MRTYAKQPKSNEELVALLQSRGLAADSAKLLRILETVGYYRFTGYLHPFKAPSSNTFRTNTTLETVWNIYMFDRHLRLTAMDALARIEIAVRAITTRCHTDFISDPFAYVNPANMPKLSQAKHGGLLARIADSTHKASNDPKIRHLATEYGITDYPPIWTMMEIVPLGIVTFYFHGLPDGVQKAIADTFHVRPNVFGQWLMALKNTRNICAHHSRLWNFHIVAPFTKRIGRDPHLAPFVECLERQPSFNYTTTFTVLSLCAYCMEIIRPESKWKERCRALLKTATPFILRGMGAPNDWETLAMWQ